MAHVAHGVPAVIVRKDEDDVGSLLRSENRPGKDQGEYGKN
jgi:hypothetical protein